MKKNILLILIALLSSIFSVNSLSAQSNKSDFEKWKEQQQKEFQKYTEKQRKELQDYRDKVNAEFAQFMSKSWVEFQAQKAIPAPKMPEPVKQPVAEPEEKPTAVPLPIEKITPLPATLPQPQPLAPIPITTLPEPVKPTDKEPVKPKIEKPESHKPEPQKEQPQPVKPAFSFPFFNTDCQVSLENTHRFSLPDATEQSVASAWKTLSENQYNTLINDCLALRDLLNLSDWGYLELLKAMSEKFLGKTSNEAVLLQMYLLTQSGYKVRIARTKSNRLALLVPFRETIYERNFLNIGGARYYVVNQELQESSFYTFNHEFPKEQYFSWQTGQPKLSEKLNSPKTFTSKNVPEINATIQTNQNLIDFFNTYPLSSEWDLYARTGLSETVKQTFYPALKYAVSGKTKAQAANMLLHFLQTTFNYQTDAEQFGYERPFFADENFFYPYNNCKDRAILYCILVHEVLGLDAVLLAYPSHLATAVHFPENVNGDYYMIEGRKFVVCDPTYINANIGMTMPHLKNVPAEVIKLKK